MAVLSDEARERVWRWFMRHNTETCNYTKAELRAAINACDAWVDDNAAAFNSALPQPFRAQASAGQKTLLLCWVAMRRAGILTVEEDG